MFVRVSDLISISDIRIFKNHKTKKSTSSVIHIRVLGSSFLKFQLIIQEQRNTCNLHLFTVKCATNFNVIKTTYNYL